MLFSNNREQLRQIYFQTWKKYQAKQPLEPMEGMILDVILQHPEYHAFLSSEENLMDDYSPESGQTNPFLHMGLHLALREQIGTNRPNGIAVIYQTLLQKYGDIHQVEHEMLDVLAQIIWEAQRNQQDMSEEQYLELFRKL